VSDAVLSKTRKGKKTSDFIVLEFVRRRGNFLQLRQLKEIGQGIAATALRLRALKFAVNWQRLS
jgi:hypothetical protein